MSSEVRQGKMPPRHIEVRTMGVRTDVPFRDLSPREKETVYHGELKKHHVHYVNPRTLEPSEVDFNYYSAVNSVKNSLAKVKDEKGMKRLEKYLKEGVCPDCHGTRLSEAARAPRLRGNRSGPGNGNDAFGTDPLGAGHAGIASERDAPHGAEHLRIVHGRFRAVDGSRPWIPVA